MNRRLDLRLDPPNLGTIQLRGPRYTPDVVKQGRHVHRSSAVCEICDAPWACYKHAYVHAGRISVACIHEAKDVVRGQCVHGGVELPRAFDPASDRRVYPRDEAREWRPRSRRHLQGFHHRPLSLLLPPPLFLSVAFILFPSLYSYSSFATRPLH